MDQRNSLESPDGQLVFNKGDKTIYTMEKRQSVQQVVFGKPGS